MGNNSSGSSADVWATVVVLQSKSSNGKVLVRLYCVARALHVPLQMLTSTPVLDELRRAWLSIAYAPCRSSTS